MPNKTREIDFTEHFKPPCDCDWSKDSPHTMYSFDRPSTILWDAIGNALLERGWSEKQVVAWMVSKETRRALDDTLGEMLRELGRQYVEEANPSKV